MILTYMLCSLAGILYGMIFTYSYHARGWWHIAAHVMRLCGAALFLIYLLQTANLPPILGAGVFLMGMWIWLLIYTQRM